MTGDLFGPPVTMRRDGRYWIVSYARRDLGPAPVPCDRYFEDETDARAFVQELTDGYAPTDDPRRTRTPDP